MDNIFYIRPNTFQITWTAILKILCRTSIEGKQIPEKQDWYNGESDPAETIPDPNRSPEALHQDVGSLPVPVQKKHFEEGVIYALVLSSAKSVTILGMVVFLKEETFDFRLFRVMGSTRKTFHEGLQDKEIEYESV